MLSTEVGKLAKIIKKKLASKKLANIKSWQNQKQKKNWHKNWLAKIWLFWNLRFHFWGAYTPNSKNGNFETKKKVGKKLASKKLANKKNWQNQKQKKIGK